MKILITGANGLLGQKLVKELSGHGYTVTATGRGSARVDFGVARYIELDLSQKEEVHRQLLLNPPDYIIHSAAITQVDKCETDQEICWQNNVMSTENLLEVASKANAGFQYISTDFVFDGTEGPYDEEAKPNPINFYGKSKHAAEQLVAVSGLHYAIVRTVLVYGVAQDLSRSNLVLWVKNSLENGKQIKVVNDQWRTPTLAEDLAIGCRLVMEKNRTGIYHISGSEYMTPYQIALQVAEVFSLDKNLIQPTHAAEFVETGTRPLKTGFNIAKARTELDYEPVALRAGLKIVKEQLESKA